MVHLPTLVIYSSRDVPSSNRLPWPVAFDTKLQISYSSLLRYRPVLLEGRMIRPVAAKRRRIFIKEQIVSISTPDTKTFGLVPVRRKKIVSPFLASSVRSCKTPICRLHGRVPKPNGHDCKPP